MPRPVWKGYISFGLVSIPVNAITVEEKSELHFHLLDSQDKSRVRYQRINETTGKVVPWNRIVKGYEYDKGEYIVIDKEDFQKASPEAFKSIDIEEFVEIKEIDSLYFDKPYYLSPDSKNKKAYVLLRETLKKTHKVGVARVIIRTKQYLCLIVPHQNALLLNLIHFPEEIRDESELNLPNESLKAYKISEGEIKMASDLVKQMTSKWNPKKYHDDYNEALVKWIESKTKDTPKGKKKVSHTRVSETTVDFMELLKKSMEKKNKKKSTAIKKTKNA